MSEIDGNYEIMIKETNFYYLKYTHILIERKVKVLLKKYVIQKCIANIESWLQTGEHHKQIWYLYSILDPNNWTSDVTILAQ